MAGVHYSGPNNSTHFTDCCGVAICDDQSRCPRCLESVPFTPHERQDMAMALQVGGYEKLAKLRSEWRQKGQSDG